MAPRRSGKKQAKRKAPPKAPGKRGGRRRTSWGKGKSGNPKGRPPLPEDYKLAMGEIGPRALAALGLIIDNAEHPRHEQAIEYALNRWKGTPTARTEIAGPGGGPIALKTVLTSDEKRRRVAELAAVAAARVAASTKKTGSDGPGGSD